jgi:hypothetical protein
MHSFVLTNEGHWTVIQQGMSEGNSMARRYHWHSAGLSSFVSGPHTAVCGVNQGMILNMTDTAATPSREGVLTISKEKPEHMMQEIQQLVLPSHHDVRTADVDLKRLGAVLWLAHERQPSDFEELLLLEGVGPRTLQSLALVSEVIHGTPVRFKDPARFAFAHGGKDGHPFPVPIKVYDETIGILQTAVQRAKVGETDKKEAIRQLSALAWRAEKDFTPNGNLDELIEKERNESWMHGGRTVFGKAQPPADKVKTRQLRLF